MAESEARVIPELPGEVWGLPVTRPDIDATVRLVRTIRDACAAYLAAVDPPLRSAGSPGIGDEARAARLPIDPDSHRAEILRLLLAVHPVGMTEREILAVFYPREASAEENGGPVVSTLGDMFDDETGDGSVHVEGRQPLTLTDVGLNEARRLRPPSPPAPPVPSPDATGAAPASSALGLRVEDTIRGRASVDLLMLPASRHPTADEVEAVGGALATIAAADALPKPAVRIREPRPLPDDFGLRLHGTVHQRLRDLGYPIGPERDALLARYRASVAGIERPTWRAKALYVFAVVERERAGRA